MRFQNCTKIGRKWKHLRCVLKFCKLGRRKVNVRRLLSEGNYYKQANDRGSRTKDGSKWRRVRHVLGKSNKM